MPGHVDLVGLDPSKYFNMLVTSLHPLNGEVWLGLLAFTFVRAVPSNMGVPTIGSCNLRGHATQALLRQNSLDKPCSTLHSQRSYSCQINLCMSQVTCSCVRDFRISCHRLSLCTFSSWLGQLDCVLLFLRVFLLRCALCSQKPVVLDRSDARLTLFVVSFTVSYWPLPNWEVAKRYTRWYAWWETACALLADGWKDYR